MNPRTTLILLAVAVALGGFIYLYEIRGGEQRREAEQEAKRFFPGLEADDIRWMELPTGEGHRARVERRDAGWELTEPLRFPGDAVALDGLASTLAGLQAERSLESQEDRQIYGLGEDASVVRFGADGKEHELRLGARAPVGSNTYAVAEGDDRVHLVATWRANSLTKRLEDLRDRRVLRFDRERVDRIVARWPGASVTLERVGPDGEGEGEAGWRVVSPVEAAADEETVDTLLSDLAFLRADGFVDDPPPPAEAGLEDPAFAVDLHLAADGDAGGAEGAQGSEAGDGRVVSFALGDTVEDGHRLARGQQPSLYRVPEERLADFPREVVRYRFRELARFVVSEARALEIAFPGDGAEPLTVRAERSAGSWQAEPVDVAPGKISDMLSELARLKGSEIVAEHAEQADLEALGLAPPRVVLRVFGTEGAAAESGGEGEDVEEATEADEEMEAEGGEAGTEPATRLLAEVQLGKADPERGIAARSPQHDAVYRIDSELAEQLPIDREAFESRFVVEEVEEEHEGLEEPEAGEGASPDGGSEAEMPLEEEAR